MHYFENLLHFFHELLRVLFYLSARELERVHSHELAHSSNFRSNRRRPNILRPLSLYGYQPCKYVNRLSEFSIRNLSFTRLSAIGPGLERSERSGRYRRYSQSRNRFWGMSTITGPYPMGGTDFIIMSINVGATGRHRCFQEDAAPYRNAKVQGEVDTRCTLFPLRDFISLVFLVNEKYYASEVIKCKDGSNSFTKDRINEVFCDCLDGTAEPDCCDGSDEYDSNVNCPNTCVMGGDFSYQRRRYRSRRKQLDRIGEKSANGVNMDDSAQRLQASQHLVFPSLPCQASQPCLALTTSCLANVMSAPVPTLCHCLLHEAVLAMSQLRPCQCLCCDSTSIMTASMPVPCHHLRLANVDVIPVPCHITAACMPSQVPCACCCLKCPRQPCHHSSIPWSNILLAFGTCQGQCAP
ncbi:hypothetical protein T459_24852 [Capsicum annuum]|uniref:Uncharacterized protein n=1 Tax=Capsicum annuum TaxID=4072 RepID=A0A2G2YJ27_CAPAN|nr:hypothetical protein T459_24852 [Capsicum annuum]